MKKLPPAKEVTTGHLEIGFNEVGEIVGNWHMTLSQRQAVYMANLMLKKVDEARHYIGVQTYTN